MARHSWRFAIASFIATLWLVASGANAENWAHWRGPSGNGVAEKSSPPIAWSDTINVQWKTAIPGLGSGSPVVWGDQVFVVTAVASTEASDGELQFQLRCYDRTHGQLIWERTAIKAVPHQGTHPTNGFASASPCTDGEHVYAHFGSRGLYCYSLDGTLKWQRADLGKMDTRHGFGEGSSPTIAGDKIIVPWDHEGPSYLYALDKGTGETIWQVARDEPSCWATPLIVEHGGRQQIVMNGENFARSYDLQTGDEIWRCGGQTERPVASPVAGGGLVFVGSGHHGAYLGAFRLSGTGDITGSSDVVWQIDRNTPDIASLLLTSGRIYFLKEKTGIISCVDAATGKPHYLSKRLPGLDMVYASPVAAGGHIYVTSRNGTTVVIDDSNELNIVGQNSVGETVDATPAPVGNQLFIRGEKHLFCIAE